MSLLANLADINEQTLKIFTYTSEKKIIKRNYEKWNGGELCDHFEIDFFHTIGSL